MLTLYHFDRWLKAAVPQMLKKEKNGKYTGQVMFSGEIYYY